ncbi:cytochrome c oxidase subunit 2 [Deinococcus seoulensis]|uniref:Cytochrome c oxidase subunit 2 n=1 Tax=Deinococcus seoulensis TaxID=1837379 RepID=A0ABQ2RW62_9DEIO|nr:cytochrome c oxidase subunit II [Deinococcus seoulensis]GGR73304.1 cytochrome c oxidase subunit 2 [Deinococcus seoulensis]
MTPPQEAPHGAPHAAPAGAPAGGLDHHTLERYETIWLGIALVMTVLLFTGVLGSMIGGTFPLLTAGVGGGHGAVIREGRLDPARLSATPFGTPGLVQTPQGLQAYIVARAFTFDPPVLRVPAGQKITLHVTATDVVHGFQVTGTNINAEILPGHVASFEVTFRHLGEQHVICNEYCGAGHQNMITRFIVEEPASASTPAVTPGTTPAKETP